MTSSIKNAYVTPGTSVFTFESHRGICQTSLGGVSQGDLIVDPDPIEIYPMDEDSIF